MKITSVVALMTLVFVSKHPLNTCFFATLFFSIDAPETWKPTSSKRWRWKGSKVLRKSGDPSRLWSGGVYGCGRARSWSVVFNGFFSEKKWCQVHNLPPKGGVDGLLIAANWGKLKGWVGFFWFKSLVLRLSAFRVVLSKEVSLWIQVLLRTYFGPPQIVPFPCIPSSGSLDL